MSKDNPALVVGALALRWPEWRDANRVPVGSCILAGRVGIEVLRYFDVGAVPMPVSVTVTCKAFTEYIKANPDCGPIGLQEQARRRFWSVGTDPDVQPSKLGGWNCHLVLDVPAVHGLLDLTLDQYARPERGIEVRQLLARYGDERPDTERMSVEVEQCGSRVRYVTRPDQTGYRTAPDWTRNMPSYPVGRLIRDVRELVRKASAA